MAASSRPVLEFLIPTYKRPEGAVRAARSIVEQARGTDVAGDIRITIVDDCSPGVSREDISVFGLDVDVVCERNDANKGMSANIFDMVHGAEGVICTVLTDDDWLQPGALREMVDVAQALQTTSSAEAVAGYFVPRYSYLESGELHCIECRPFSVDKVIRPSPLNGVKYARNGFILTGFFFRPKLIDFGLWRRNLENGYFPVLNFGALLFKYPIVFFDRNWFVHTVLNQCHWEAWGENELMQRRKLTKDFIEVLSVLATQAATEERRFGPKVLIRVEEMQAYLRRLVNLRQLGFESAEFAPELAGSRAWFRAAEASYPLWTGLRRGNRWLRGALRGLTG
jgi:glycosyltransferase involved in cell wall biosynthesis